MPIKCNVCGSDAIVSRIAISADIERPDATATMVVIRCPNCGEREQAVSVPSDLPTLPENIS